MLLNKIANTDKEIEICGLTADSREVKPGYLFGSLNDDKFIEDAIRNGAVAVVLNKNCKAVIPDNIVAIYSDNPARDFAIITAKFFGKQPQHICAVTGTNGKTSIADFIRQILTMMNLKAASSGTLGVIKGNGEMIPTLNTTPVSVTMMKNLKDLTEEGYDWLVTEASSHGLCQYRLGGIKVDVAGFTNLTRDHLDYHHNMENYLNAKLILFKDNLKEGGVAVLNADIDEYEIIANACSESGKKIVSYGYKGKELQLIKATPLAHGQLLDFVYYGKKLSIEIPLAGEFQAMNILCALGMAAEFTKKPDEVIKFVSKIKGANGRMQLAAQTKEGAAVYIDYAHTPDALENVIRALRPHCSGKLQVLFGCGGNRDSGKRAIMGKIANDLADEVYITDDNPRFEDADLIREAIKSTCPKGKNIAGRDIAIREAINNLHKGDILVLAGKGHETGQYVKGKILPFSDLEEVKKVLAI